MHLLVGLGLLLVAKAVSSNETSVGTTRTSDVPSIDWRKGLNERGEPLNRFERLQIANNGKLAPGWSLVPRLDGNLRMKRGLVRGVNLCSEKTTDLSNLRAQGKCGRLKGRCYSQIWQSQLRQTEQFCMVLGTCGGETVWNENCECKEDPECKGKSFTHTLDDFTCDPGTIDRLPSVAGLQWIGDNKPCMIGMIKYEHSCPEEGEWVNLMWAQTPEFQYVGEFLKIEILTDIANIDDYSCVNKEGGQVCLKCDDGHCNGDDVFLKSFRNNPRSTCFCKLKGDKNLFNVVTDVHGREKGICYGKKEFYIKRKKFEEPVEMVVKNCAHCEVKCSKNGLVFSSAFTPIQAVFACANPSCVSADISAHVGLLNFKPQMLTGKRDVSYRFWLEGDATAKVGTITCSEFDFCLSYDNWYDFGLIIQPHCWGKVKSSTIIGTTIAVLIILTLSICVLSLAIALWFVSRPIRYLCWFLAKLPLRLIGSVYVWAHKEAQKEMQGTTPLLPRTRKDTYEVRPYRSAPILKKSFLVVVALASVSTCDYSTTFNVRSESCKQEGKEMTCTFNFETRLAVVPVGQTASLLMMGPENGVLGSVEVKTLEVHFACEEVLLYYTAPIAGDAVLKTECGGGSCQERECLSYPSTGVLIEHRSKSLSTHKCHWIKARMGCLWDKITGGGECWWSWAKLRKQGESCAVKRCSTWKKMALVEVTKMDKTGRRSARLLLEPTVATSALMDFEIEAENVIVEKSHSMDECFMVCGKKTSLVDCNERDDLRRNRVGQLQCPTQHDVDEMTDRCFLAPDAVEVHALSEERALRLDIHQIDLASAAKLKPLPYSAGGSLIMPTENGSIISTVTSNSQFTLNLKSKEFKLITLEQTLKCNSKFLNITGCYSCESGALAAIEVGTEWGAGLAHLTCPDGASAAFPVNDTMEVKELNLHFTTPHIDMVCEIQCSKTKMALRMVGSLITIPEIQDLDRSETNVSRSKGETPNTWLPTLPHFLSNFITNLANHLIQEFAIGFCILALLTCIGLFLYAKVQSYISKKIL